LDFAANVPLHGVVPPPIAEKSPLVADVKLRLWLWLFVRVIVCGDLEVPTFVAAKVRFADIETASCPEPVRVTT